MLFTSTVFPQKCAQWKAASCFPRRRAGSPLPGPPPTPGSAPVPPAGLLWAGPCSFRRGCVTGHRLDSGSCRQPQRGRALWWGSRALQACCQGHLPSPGSQPQTGTPSGLPRSRWFILTCSRSGLRDALVAWFCCGRHCGLGRPSASFL